MAGVTRSTQEKNLASIQQTRRLPSHNEVTKTGKTEVALGSHIRRVSDQHSLVIRTTIAIGSLIALLLIIWLSRRKDRQQSF